MSEVAVGLIFLAFLVCVMVESCERSEYTDTLASCRTFEAKELRDQCRLDVVKSRLAKQNKGEQQ